MPKAVLRTASTNGQTEALRARPKGADLLERNSLPIGTEAFRDGNSIWPIVAWADAAVIAVEPPVAGGGAQPW